MPNTRRTQIHAERLDAFGETLTLLIATVEEVTEDGRIEPSEDQLLHRVIARVRTEYPALPAEASAIDGATRLIVSLGTTMSVTSWTERIAREERTSEVRLIHDGLIEAVAA